MPIYQTLISTFLFFICITPSLESHTSLDLDKAKQVNHQQATPTALTQKKQENIEDVAKLYQDRLTEPGAGTFTPPKDWMALDPRALPKNTRFMVIANQKQGLSPSMNISEEKFNGSLKEYLRIVQKLKKESAEKWQEIGMTSTKGGKGSLSQTFTNSEWGKIKMLHFITKQSGTIYIITAAALEKEFPKFYNSFFEAIRSFKVNEKR